MTSASFRILIANDETAESEENFQLHIHPYSSGYYHVSVHNNTRTIVHIDDDDCKLQIVIHSYVTILVRYGHEFLEFDTNAKCSNNFVLANNCITLLMPHM